MTTETWAIRADYSFEAVKIDRETDKTVWYWPVHRSHDAEPRRGDKRYFLDLRSDKATVQRIVAKLKSAKGEHDRRKSEAATWFSKRKAEILAEGAGS